MSVAAVRIDLPSGGWWEIAIRPLWTHIQQWAAVGQDQRGDLDTVGRALVSLTVAWSFREEPSAEALALRDDDDIIAVLEAFQRDVIPCRRGGEPKEMAQELFVGLAAGQVPPRFEEVHMMAATGWSWRTLQETPVDVVRQMAVYLAVKQAMDSGGALEYPHMEDEQDAQ